MTLLPPKGEKGQRKFWGVHQHPRKKSLVSWLALCGFRCRVASPGSAPTHTAGEPFLMGAQKLSRLGRHLHSSLFTSLNPIALQEVHYFPHPAVDEPVEVSVSFW